MLLHYYKVIEKNNHSLTKIYGNLHVGNMHYVSVFSDINMKTFQTLNPLDHDDFHMSANVTMMGKWMAKYFSIIDYYFEKKKKKNLYFGSKEMQISYQVLENETKKVRSRRKSIHVLS